MVNFALTGQNVNSDTENFASFKMRAEIASAHMFMCTRNRCFRSWKENENLSSKTKNSNVVKKKPNRRAKQRNNKNKVNNITIMGVNAAGISSKLNSFKNVVRQLQLSIFFC